MTERERSLLIAVAEWIDVNHFMPFENNPFGPSADDEATAVHYALAELDSKD